MLGLGAANPTNPKFLKARLDALEMLRLRAPPLPEDLERAWPRFQAWYAKVVVNTEKKRPEWNPGTGALNFVRRLDSLQKALGTQPAAFEQWVRKEAAGMPAEATVLRFAAVAAAGPAAASSVAAPAVPPATVAGAAPAQPAPKRPRRA